MTTYTIQKRARIGRETCWYDVTECVEIRATAEAMLGRWVEDCPRDDFRIAEWEV